MDSHIITECFVDTLLVETVSPPSKGYNHQNCCTKVLNVMNTKFANSFALGIIDDDKVVPKSFDPFYLVKKHNNHLALYKHESRPHYIIKLSKAAEDFILKTAQQCGISLDAYNLPVDLENFKKKTKHIISKKDPDLKNLFVELKSNHISDFHKLAQWIDYLKTHPYGKPEEDYL
jgi:hypothetical protein